MTRTISLITAVAGLALVLATPALGQQQDFWNYDEQGQKVTNTSPGLGAEDLANLYSSDAAGQSSPIVSPDAVDRAVAAREAQQASLSPTPDVVERAVAARMTDGRELVFDNHKVDLPLGASGRELVFDNHKVEPIAAPVTVEATGNERDWPQLGIAFGIGIALMLGLFAALRLRETRPLAH
jgi:hypothetical protein